MEQHDLSDAAEFTLLDFNEETLRYAESVINDARRRHHRATNIRMVKKSVANVLKAWNGDHQYDLIYCAGLFDYLQDRVCKQLMNLMYGALAPGGTLIATNVDSGNPIQRIMDFIFEWHLLYRTGSQMNLLLPERTAPDQCRISADATGCNIFMEVTRPSNNHERS
jgi:extracellular factor (EF) 3-hydroxypalmitic acid methyl ester biosynthesis protein